MTVENALEALEIVTLAGVEAVEDVGAGAHEDLCRVGGRIVGLVRPQEAPLLQPLELGLQVVLVEREDTSLALVLFALGVQGADPALQLLRIQIGLRHGVRIKMFPAM